MINKVNTSSQNVASVYMKIRKARPGWFSASIKKFADDYAGFATWIHDGIVGWYEADDFVIFIEPQTYYMRIHPAILGRLNQSDLEEVMQDIETVYRRTEISVINPNGHAMRKMMRSLGFRLEGILCDREVTYDSESHTFDFYDVEMWARIKGRNKDGQDH